MMFDFANWKVVILGLARQGSALARFFAAAGAQVTISDMAPAEKLQDEITRLSSLPIAFALGGHPPHLLDGCNLLCLSGGVPPQLEIVQSAIARGIPLSNDSLLTLQLARQKGLGPLIALTGSSGKTTTTTLVGKMLTDSGKPVHVGGNIGSPLIDRLDAIQPGDAIVLELSSFQLELFDPAVAWGPLARVGPDVAAILNVTPNHLDRHPNMAAYAGAKFNLLRYLPPTATVVLNADDRVTQRLETRDWGLETGDQRPETGDQRLETRDQRPETGDRRLETGDQRLETGDRRPETLPLPRMWGMETVITEIQSSVSSLQSPAVPFSRLQPLTRGAWLEGEKLVYNGDPFCTRNEIKLRGDHNISNLLAAAAISGAAGATLEGMRQVAQSFTGVAHRLEVVQNGQGATWINDSIATAPERVVAALRCFEAGKQTLILLAGGKDKNLPWEIFADEVLARVSFLIGFGHAGSMIVNTVQQRAQYNRARAPSCAVVQRLDEAVELAARVAVPSKSHAVSGEHGAPTLPTVILLSPGGASYDAYRDFEQRGEHFRQLVTKWNL